MTTITEYLAEQKRLAGAATPGPWEWHSHQTVDGDSWAVFDAEDRALADNRDGWTPDAAFIAAARESVPRLVAALEAVVALAEQHRSIEQHNEMVPITNISALIREPSSAEYLAAIEAALGGERDA